MGRILVRFYKALGIRFFFGGGRWGGETAAIIIQVVYLSFIVQSPQCVAFHLKTLLGLGVAYVI